MAKEIAKISDTALSITETDEKVTSIELKRLIALRDKLQLKVTDLTDSINQALGKGVVEEVAVKAAEAAEAVLEG